MTGTGSSSLATDVDDVAGDAGAAHAEHDDVADRVGASGSRRRPARPRPAASCAAGELLGQRRATASRNPSESVTSAQPARTAIVAGERGLDAVGLGLGEQPLVLRVVDGLGLVDQHDRDVVAHRVPPLQPRVVQRAARRRSTAAGPCPRGRRGSRAASGRAPCRCLLRVPRRHASDLISVEHLGGVSVAREPVGCLEVEAQQRLGVARPQVEPPVARVDGEPVEAVLVARRRTPRRPARSPRAGRRRVVLISPRLRVALERLAQLRERHAGPAQLLEHQHRGDEPGVGAPVVAEVVVRRSARRRRPRRSRPSPA